MLFLEAYIIFSTFSFPLGTISPLHNFIKMYKLSKIYTRGRRAKAAITEKTTKISLSIQVTQKKKNCKISWHQKHGKSEPPTSQWRWSSCVHSQGCASNSRRGIFTDIWSRESQDPLLTSMPLLVKPVKGSITGTVLWSYPALPCKFSSSEKVRDLHVFF